MDDRLWQVRAIWIERVNGSYLVADIQVLIIEGSQPLTYWLKEEMTALGTDNYKFIY